MAQQPVARPLDQGADRARRGRSVNSATAPPAEDQGKDDHPVGEGAQQGLYRPRPRRRGSPAATARASENSTAVEISEVAVRPETIRSGGAPRGGEHLIARRAAQGGAAGDHVAHGVAR